MAIDLDSKLWETSKNNNPAVSASTLKKVRALACKAKYKTPSVSTFPIDGMKIAGPVTLAGNMTDLE